MGLGFITTLTNAELLGTFKISVHLSPVNSPLQLISGVVSGLTIHSGEEEFVRSREQQAAGVGAAAGLAVEGLAGAAAGAGLAAASAGDAVEFFSCKVGGQLVEGRFSKASFKDDDQLDFVLDISSVTKSPYVLAARRSRDATLWMVPHCSRGTMAHRGFALRMCWWLVIGFPTFAMSTFLAWAFFSRSPTDIGAIQFMGGISLVMGITAALYYSIRFYRQWLPIAQQAE